MPGETENEYYVTINPSPRKLHNFISYDNMCDTAQAALIKSVVDKCMRWCKIRHSDIHYEFTKRGVIHAHLCIWTTQRRIIQFSKNVNTRLGSERLCPTICAHYCDSRQWVPKINPETDKPYVTWEEYMNKDNVLHPKKIVCQCIVCKIERQDKVIMKKIDYGDILISE